MTQPKTVVLVVALAILLVAGFFFPSPLERISVPPDLIFSLGPIRITNSILGTWLSMLVLLVLGWLGTRNLQLAPTGWLQNLFEMIIEGLLNLVEGVAGHENAKRFFPLVATIFFFILVNNWMGLVPGFNTWGCFIDDAGHASPPLCSSESAMRNAPHAAPAAPGGEQPAAPGTTPRASPAPGVKPAEKHSSVAPGEEIGGRLASPVLAEEAHHFFVPIFRSAATDLNTTLALAIIAVAMIQYWGFQTLGVHYLSKFFTLKGFPIGTFVGLLELISELSKVISFSFRLFG
ncbi:MAG: F0F1 ATP synthase subunit A, partial [Chloroflexi bacterium]|nr:F0F1 ATP synthase subunit A [Chloroflexota bacterium]